MPTVFPHSLRDLKASQIGRVHLRFVTDLNVEDFDDYEVILKVKAAMQLLYKANLQLRPHPTKDLARAFAPSYQMLLLLSHSSASEPLAPVASAIALAPASPTLFPYRLTRDDSPDSSATHPPRSSHLPPQFAYRLVREGGRYDSSCARRCNRPRCQCTGQMSRKLHILRASSICPHWYSNRNIDSCMCSTSPYSMD